MRTIAWLRRWGWMMMVLAFGLALAQSGDPLDVQSDPRLKQAVSLQEPAIPLSELLKKLSEQSEVPLQVDRALANYRACIAVKKQSLRDVMFYLGEAFGFKWERKAEKEKPPTYLLYQDASSRQAEQKELERVQKQGLQLVRDLIQHLKPKLKPENLEALLQEYRTNFEKRRHSKPPEIKSREEAYKYLLETSLFPISPPDSDLILVTYLLSRFSPPDWNRLTAEEVMEFSTDQPNSLLPPNAMQLWFAGEERRWTQIQAANPQLSEKAAEFYRDMLERYRTLDRMRLMLLYDPEKGAIQFVRQVRGNDPKFLGSSTEEQDFNKGSLSIERSVDYFLLQQNPPQLPDHPALQNPFPPLPPNQKEPQDWWNKGGYWLLQGAESAERPLIAEWYPLYRSDSGYTLQPPSTWKNLHETLHKRGYQLQVKGDWLLVSQTKRALARAFDLPETRLRGWFLKPKLTLDDCVEIAKLHAFYFRFLQEVCMEQDHTGEQRYWNLYTPMQLLRQLEQQKGLREALRFYGLLTNVQKNALQGGQPLLYRSLTPTQQRAFLRVVRSQLPGEPFYLQEGEDPEEMPSEPHVRLEVDVDEDELERPPSWRDTARGIPPAGQAFEEWLDSQPPEVERLYRISATMTDWTFRFIWDSSKSAFAGFTIWVPNEPKEQKKPATSNPKS